MFAQNQRHDVMRAHSMPMNVIECVQRSHRARLLASSESSNIPVSIDLTLIASIFLIALCRCLSVCGCVCMCVCACVRACACMYSPVQLPLVVFSAIVVMHPNCCGVHARVNGELLHSSIPLVKALGGALRGRYHLACACDQNARACAEGKNEWRLVGVLKDMCVCVCVCGVWCVVCGACVPVPA
jgi:hypothetical protein